MSRRLALFVGFAAFLFAGGAIPCELGPEQEVLCQVSADYLKAVFGYERTEYSLKLLSDSDGKSTLLVSHKDDMTSIVPGGGKSMELVINNTSSTVEKHFLFQ